MSAASGWEASYSTRTSEVMTPYHVLQRALDRELTLTHAEAARRSRRMRICSLICTC